VLSACDLLRGWPTGDGDLPRRRVDALLPARPRRLLPGLDIATAAVVLAEYGIDAAAVNGSARRAQRRPCHRRIVGLVAGEKNSWTGGFALQP